MAKKTRENAELLDNAIHHGDRPTAESVGVEGNGESNPAITPGDAIGRTTAVMKASGPRNRTESSYWVVAFDPMNGTSEFLMEEATVGKGRKARMKLMGSPMARGRKIRLARVTYVEG